MFGDRIGRLLFKQTVEHNVMNHILARDTDIDAATYQKMRGMSYQEVAGRRLAEIVSNQAAIKQLENHIII